MKLILTILISLGAFTTSFAQHRPEPGDDYYIYNDSRRFGGNFSPRDKEFLIDRINREFDFKIYAIKNSWNLSHHQKKVAIRNLENERAWKIHTINERFYNRRRDYDNHWHNR